MSYLSQSQLETDTDFQRRVRAVNTEQAEYFKDAAGLDQKALAYAVLRDEPGPQQALLRLAAGGPGVADKVDTGDGSIDQSLVTDADLLALTQANWPAVAMLYFDSEGNPI